MTNFQAGFLVGLIVGGSAALCIYAFIKAIFEYFYKEKKNEKND